MPHVLRSLVITFILSLLCPARANAILEVYCEDSQGRIFKLPSTEASKYKVYSWKYLFFERDEPLVTENAWGSIQSHSIVALTNFKNQNIAIENEVERLTNNVSQTTFKNFLGPIRVLSPVKNIEALNLLDQTNELRSKLYLSVNARHEDYLDELLLLNNAAFDLSKISINNFVNFPTNTLRNSVFYTRTHETLKKLSSLLAIQAPVNKYSPSIPRLTPAPAPISPAPKNVPKPAPQVAPLNELPYGIALKDRPGFVQSPFAAPQQLVDVTGLPPGMEVKCPYTGKLFRVPQSLTKTFPTPATVKEAPVDTIVNDLPYGSPIKDKPGFVQSPFAAKHQLVDVTGLPVGMEVKCPYTGKLFRVPPPFGSR